MIQIAEISKNLTELLLGKESISQLDYVNAACQFDDVNAFAFQDDPTALKWFELSQKQKNFNWFNTNEAKELFDSADSEMRRALFLEKMLDSLYVLLPELKKEFKELYFAIVQKLNLNYSEFMSPDGLFGNILHNFQKAQYDIDKKLDHNQKIKELTDANGSLDEGLLRDVTKYASKFISPSLIEELVENLFDYIEPISNDLIIALRKHDGSPVYDDELTVVKSFHKMPRPDIYDFNDETHAVLTSYVLHFHDKYTYQYLRPVKLEMLSQNGKGPRIYEDYEILENETRPDILRYSLSEDVLITYLNSVNDAKRVIFNLERIDVSSALYFPYKKGFKIIQNRFYKAIDKFQPKLLSKSQKFADLKINNTVIENKKANTGLLSIVGLVIGVIFAITGSIPLQLLSGLLIVVGIMGTLKFLSDVNLVKATAKNIYTILVSTKAESKAFCDYLNKQLNINEMTDISIESERYKEFYAKTKERQALADKLYAEDPQQFHNFDINVSDEESDDYSQNVCIKIAQQKLIDDNFIEAE